MINNPQELERTIQYDIQQLNASYLNYKKNPNDAIVKASLQGQLTKTLQDLTRLGELMVTSKGNENIHSDAVLLEMTQRVEFIRGGIYEWESKDNVWNENTIWNLFAIPFNWTLMTMAIYLFILLGLILAVLLELMARPKK